MSVYARLTQSGNYSVLCLEMSDAICNMKFPNILKFMSVVIVLRGGATVLRSHHLRAELGISIYQLPRKHDTKFLHNINELWMQSNAVE